MSDEVFDVFKRQMAYVKSPLNARVESRNASKPDWIREKSTFDAGYEAGRVSAYLSLPARRQASVSARGDLSRRLGRPGMLMPPEADAINYVSRVKIPVLMLGGRHDYIFPLETAQKPMFDRLGTPADQKRHVVFDSGHNNFPRSETIREVLGWLDRYLGPINTPAAAPSK